MSRWLSLAATLVLALGWAAPGESLAGTPEDPNAHDTVLGKIGGLRYAADQAAYDLGSGFGSVVAGCGGPRWHLIGGGAATHGPASDGWLAANRPDDYLDADTQPDDGFLGGGFGPGGQHLVVYSICIRGAALRYRMETIDDQPSALRHGTASCGGARWHVTSGSVFIATSDSWVRSSFPIDRGDPDRTPDDGWGGLAYDTVGGLGGFLVSAICVKGLELRYVRGGSRMVAPGGSLGRGVGCGARWHVVGGGARVSGAGGGTRLVTSAPYDGPDADRIPDDGWRSRVYNLSHVAKRVTPYAICLG